ncbi:MAG: tRNA preQ1(34) S-adenosylmethionine ribosyltransferase-isomerase QueA [Alphaproteobacteria bacterium]|nr:tRNA preQ1(34) S-adenosylmethionine ribosyltransferase-isomerase QueA [Alphaproteobacteria bacterium]
MCLKTADFDYDLPDEAIAKTPIIPRDDAKLLCVTANPQSCQMIDKYIYDLPNLLNPHDLLIVNNSKTLPALLHGVRIRSTDDNAQPANIKCNLLTPQNYQNLWASPLWIALAYPSKKLKIGDRVMISDDFHWELQQKFADGRILLRFNCANDQLQQNLQKYGKMPIPPYLKRDSNQQDITDYQTLFAEHHGAVATPTAGLHFTDKLLTNLRAKHINIATVTLHVGAGTFLPVKTDNISDHVIHQEWGELPQATIDSIKQCRAKGGKIIAVGTTSLRLLEWAMQNKGRNKDLEAQSGMVDIFITPPFDFKLCDKLLTNFHQPRSTLLALVSAFIGHENILTAYQHALASDYRFLSYGDACLLERKHD